MYVNIIKYMNKTKLLKILKNEFNVKTTDTNVRLNDFLDNVIKTNNRSDFITRNIKDNIKIISKEPYITSDLCIALLDKTKRQIGQKIIARIKIKDNITTVDTKNNIYKFNGTQIDVIYDKDTEIFWFKGKPIGHILSYKHTDPPIKRFVDNKNKITYGEIKFIAPLLYVKGTVVDKSTMFLNSKGVVQLINKNTLCDGSEFKRWFKQELIPELKNKTKETNITTPVVSVNKYEVYKQDNLNMIKLMFEQVELIGIRDDDDQLWFKCKDVAKTLGYINTKSTIIDHVNDKYVTTLDELFRNKGGRKFLPPSNYQKNTKYTNESGLYELASKSKKPFAKIFQQWLFEDVLPTIRKTGKYDLDADIESCFLDDNHIDDYKKENVNYIGYIGKYNGVKHYKYGYTDDFNKREIEHIKEYGKFIVKYIGKCFNNKGIERQFERHLDRHSLKRTIKINNTNHKEIFVSDDNYCIEHAIERIDSLINKHNEKYLNNKDTTLAHDNNNKTNLLIEQEKTKQMSIHAKEDKINRIMAMLESGKITNNEAITFFEHIKTLF